MTLFKLKPANDTELRLFACLQVLFFSLLCFAAPQLSTVTIVLKVLLAASLVIGIAGAIIPALIRPVHRIWMMLVLPIGWMISQLLLAAVYYLVVTPIGMWRRIRHGDPLQRDFDASAVTYWEKHRQKSKPNSYFRQF